MNLATASRLKTFRACPRLEQIKYRLLVVPTKARPALDFGTLVHWGLESYWSEIRAGNHDGAVGVALDRMGAHPLSEAFENAKATAMMAAYGAYWADFARSVTVLSVEGQFRAPLANPDDIRMVAKTWERAGKIDAIVRLESGMVAVLEHKTAGADVGPGSSYRGALAMDAQISMYFHGSLAMGHPANLCIYDILKKPRIEPKKATPLSDRKYKHAGGLYAGQNERDEAVVEYRDRVVDLLVEKADDYFVHVEVGRTKLELDRDARDGWHTVRAMTEAQKANYFPRNPDACFRYGSACEYLGVCQGVESLDDPSKFRRMKEPHPELREEKK